MALLNLVQQGAELAYLLLHDPEFRSRVRREHLVAAGKMIPLKQNIDLLYRILGSGIDGYHFDFYVLSAAPVEMVRAALEGLLPADHIFGTEFKYNAAGEIETLTRATAGYGKVRRIDQLQADLQIGPDHVIYAGDGSSDLHAMLHVNGLDGLTIAVSESRDITQIAKRTVLSANALAMLVPILEKVVGWQQPQIRDFFESHGFLVQEWAKVRTDWLTLRPAEADTGLAESATA
jgi:phosphoglycolate phosphatase-like HAD superfamily hydrolase